MQNEEDSESGVTSELSREENKFSLNYFMRERKRFTVANELSIPVNLLVDLQETLKLFKVNLCSSCVRMIQNAEIHHTPLPVPLPQAPRKSINLGTTKLSLPFDSTPKKRNSVLLGKLIFYS